MGKGSKRRKCQVSQETETANWEAVFGKKKFNIMSHEERKEMLEELIKIEERENFLKTLDNASEIVGKWPEWKQNALGKLRHGKDV